MDKVNRLLLIIAGAAVLLAGCDDFSLKDKLELGGQEAQKNPEQKPGQQPEEAFLLLVPSKDTLPTGETTDLTVKGGTAPYSFKVSVKDLYDKTSLEPIGDVLDGKFTAGTAIGRIRIGVEDTQGAKGETTVDVVPPTPQITGISVAPSKIDPTHIDITISFRIDGKIPPMDLVLERAVAPGSDFNAVSYPAVTQTEVIDRNVVNQGYTYRLYATAGKYYSLPSYYAWPTP